MLEASRNHASQSNKRDEARTRPTALVVDDNPINRFLAKEMLHVLGYECDTAANGREAVEYVERYRPDVVLMDLDMPEMDTVLVEDPGRPVPERRQVNRAVRSHHGFCPEPAYPNVDAGALAPVGRRGRERRSDCRRADRAPVTEGRALEGVAEGVRSPQWRRCAAALVRQVIRRSPAWHANARPAAATT